MRWMALAFHLRLPVQVVKAQTTVSEFYEWAVFLREHQSREDYYWAQIAAEICKTRVKDPNAVKTEHFLIKFKAPDSKDSSTFDPSKLSPEEQKAYRKKLSQEGLAIWRGIAKGSGQKDTNKKPTRKKK